MKISTGNQLLGKIEKIDIGAVTVKVYISIGNSTISADISKYACKKLGLKEGIAAIAAINPIDIMICSKDLNISADNKIPGTITKILPGKINTNVIVKISEEDELTAIVSNNSLAELEAFTGNEVFLIFNDSSVIVAC